METGRQDIEEAYSMLYHIQLMQAMAFSSEGQLGKGFNLVAYAALLDEFIPRLLAALQRIEQCLIAA